MFIFESFLLCSKMSLMPYMPKSMQTYSRALSSGNPYAVAKGLIDSLSQVKRNPAVGRYVNNVKKRLFPSGPVFKPKPKRKRVAGGGGGRKPPSFKHKGKARYSSPAVWSGKFRRQRRVRVGKIAAYGAMIKTEYGGEVTDPECVFVGHSTCAPEKVLRVAVMAILRRLFKKAGIDIKAFSDSPREWVSPPSGASGVGNFIYYFSDGEVSAVTERQIGMGLSDNYDDLATSIVSDMKTQFASVNQPHLHKFDLMLFTQNSVTAHPTVPHRLEASKLFVDLVLGSELTIQNRTIASTGGTGDEHRDATDVQNNPLEGYGYYCSGNSFRLASRKSTTAFPEFGPDLTYGQITQTYTTVNSNNAEDGANVIRPPNAFFFKNTKRTQKHRVMPGTMKKSSLKWRKTYHINKLMRLLEHWFAANGVEGTSVFIGSARMFAWEKLMHTRGATEPDMIVGYECNNFYGATVKMGRLGVVCEKDVQ